MLEVGLRQVGSREGKSSQTGGKGKPLSIAVLLTLPHCSVGKSRSIRNLLTVTETVVSRVTVKVQARYYPQDLHFEICCDKIGNGEKSFSGKFILHWSHHPWEGQSALKNKDETIEQKPFAGINRCSFVQGIFFLPLRPNTFKVTTVRHEAFS
jgi:hypothetical protein